jgi:Lar family restriction alleviation protein
MKSKSPPSGSLRECPFCGVDEAMLLRGQYTFGAVYSYIQCRWCGVTVEFALGVSQQDAVKRWNERACVKNGATEK